MWVVDLHDSIADESRTVNSAPRKRSPAIDFTGFRQIAATVIGIQPLHERQTLWSRGTIDPLRI